MNNVGIQVLICMKKHAKPGTSACMVHPPASRRQSGECCRLFAKESGIALTPAAFNLIPPHGVTHRTGSVQWTWIKTAGEHYDTIAMNECRMIRAHSAHLDLPKPKKSCANAKNEHGNSWPFSTLGQLHRRIVQIRLLSCKRWLPSVYSHPSHKNCPLHIAIMKKEPGSEMNQKKK